MSEQYKVGGLARITGGKYNRLSPRRPHSTSSTRSANANIGKGRQRHHTAVFYTGKYNYKWRPIGQSGM